VAALPIARRPRSPGSCRGSVDVLAAMCAFVTSGRWPREAVEWTADDDGLTDHWEGIAAREPRKIN